MILTNPEGRKESDETIIQTDEDGAKQKALHKLINYAFISHFFNENASPWKFSKTSPNVSSRHKGQIWRKFHATSIWYSVAISLSRMRIFCCVFLLLQLEFIALIKFCCIGLCYQFQEQFPASH